MHTTRQRGRKREDDQGSPILVRTSATKFPIRSTSTRCILILAVPPRLMFSRGRRYSVFIDDAPPLWTTTQIRLSDTMDLPPIAMLTQTCCSCTLI
ncbi:hypothetical protein PAXRUDRAFT_835176 [Paxillus rubicundulus Ve08.2h10]|uniref:Uncharacterized protein n=1 Tax=Paxillus rubicundulus Ve08.2h10 TaxID=930991 RepID=A0A0D0D074_9AGAM|nr:hypothetical protein PAXRUDRAFT_835176 [Paxillus rubicundulus Ve08.2h10]